MRVVVMGVSGCGKSTIGRLLATSMGLEFLEGDRFHSPANVGKMAAGIALDDCDRWPWLEQVALALSAPPSGAVIGCSALKRSYRDYIRRFVPDVKFVHLHGDYGLLSSRIASRPGHFMPASLLQSQFDTLEMLTAQEDGAVFDAGFPPEEIVSSALRWLRSESSSTTG